MFFRQWPFKKLSKNMQLQVAVGLQATGMVNMNSSEQAPYCHIRKLVCMPWHFWCGHMMDPASTEQCAAC